jgi:uncharacterized protein (TIGR03086 family)
MNANSDVPDVVATYDLVSAAMGRLVAGVRPEQWSDPTPCTDWTVRMLVNHVVTGTQVFIANITGEALPDRTRDNLGDDPAAAFATAAQRLHDAFVAPGVMDNAFPSPLGELPGRFLVQMRVTEQLVHGWDLGQATGQTLDVPDVVVERTLAGVQQNVPGGAREGDFFKDEQPCGDGTPLDRLAAYLGRPVSA